MKKLILITMAVILTLILSINITYARWNNSIQIETISINLSINLFDSWNPNIRYDIGDIIEWNGSLYIAIKKPPKFINPGFIAGWVFWKELP